MERPFQVPEPTAVRSPFSAVTPPTSGAIVPYRPPTTAIVRYVPPSSTLPSNPLPPPRAAPKVPNLPLLERLRQNTLNQPLPKNWDVGMSRPSGLTPKGNMPLINRINRRMAQGLGGRATQTVTRVAAPATGLKVWGGRALRFGNRALGVFGLLTLAADLMEMAKPAVWEFLGYDPNRQAGGAQGTSSETAVQFPHGGRAYYVAPGTETPSSNIQSPTNEPFSVYVENPYIHHTPGTAWNETPWNGYIRAVVVKADGTKVYGGSQTVSRLPDIRIVPNAGPLTPGTPGPMPSSPSIGAGLPTPTIRTERPDTVPSQPSETGVPQPDDRTRPRNPTPVLPLPYPDPDPESPPPKPPPEVKPGECDPCEALEWIVEQMKQQPKTPRTYLLDVPYAVCEGKESEKEGKIQYFSFEVVNIPNGWRDVFTASAELGLKGCECNDNAVASIPDWWQVRLGAERPQLVVVFKIAGTTAYHQIAIPHPAISEPPGASPLPPYRKGPYQGQIVLADNSKFTINAASESEAQRMIDAAIRAIASGRIGSEPRVHIGLRKGVAVKEANMVPIRLDYYPTGQRDMNPAWRKRLESSSSSR